MIVLVSVHWLFTVFWSPEQQMLVYPVSHSQVVVITRCLNWSLFHISRGIMTTRVEMWGAHELSCDEWRVGTVAPQTTVLIPPQRRRETAWKVIWVICQVGILLSVSGPVVHFANAVMLEMWPVGFHISPMFPRVCRRGQGDDLSLQRTLNYAWIITENMFGFEPPAVWTQRHHSGAFTWCTKVPSHQFRKYFYSVEIWPSPHIF